MTANEMLAAVVKDGVVRVSPSGLDDMMACSQLYAYRRIHRRESNRPAGARDAGKAFDAAVSAVARLLPAHNVDESLDKGRAALAVAWPPEMPEDEAWRTPVRYGEVLDAYVRHYADEPFDVLGTQVAFECRLGDVSVARIVSEPSPVELREIEREQRVTVKLHGIADRVVRMRDSGVVAVLDTKVKKSWDAFRVAADYENNGQAMAYCYGLPRDHAVADRFGIPRDVPLTTFVLDAVIVRPPYANANRKVGANDLPRHEFHRPTFPYLPERLEEWRVEALLWVEDALRQAASGRFRMNRSACAWHYGGRCPYLDVDAMPNAQQRAIMLATDQYRDYTSPFDTNDETDA
jgi:RecB family exonuclease